MQNNAALEGPRISAAEEDERSPQRIVFCEPGFAYGLSRTGRDNTAPIRCQREFSPRLLLQCRMPDRSGHGRPARPLASAAENPNGGFAPFIQQGPSYHLYWSRFDSHHPLHLVAAACRVLSSPGSYCWMT